MSAKDPPIASKSATTTTTTTTTDDPPRPGLLFTDPQHGWWDTFNAAITGFCQYKPYLDSGPEYIKIQAKLIADTVHGEYPPDPPPEP